jgi:hypothetical protein
MDVLRAPVYGMQMPATNPAMVGNRGFHNATLFDPQGQGRFRHESLSGVFAVNVGGLEFAGFVDPTPFVPRQPGAIGGPGQEICQWFGHGNPSLFRCHV